MTTALRCAVISDPLEEMASTTSDLRFLLDKAALNFFSVGALAIDPMHFPSILYKMESASAIIVKARIESLIIIRSP